MSDVYGMAAAIAETETELGQTMLLRNVSYPCVAGARNDTQELGVGGYATGGVLEVVVRVALFNGEPPTLDDEITVNERRHKINSIVTSSCGTCLVLSCDDANKDA